MLFLFANNSIDFVPKPCSSLSFVGKLFVSKLILPSYLFLICKIKRPLLFRKINVTDLLFLSLRDALIALSKQLDITTTISLDGIVSSSSKLLILVLKLISLLMHCCS